MTGKEVDQTLQHHQPMSATNHLGMHGEIEQPTRHIAIREGEFITPDLLYQGGRFQPTAGGVEFKVWEIVQGPRDR